MLGEQAVADPSRVEMKVCIFSLYFPYIHFIHTNIHTSINKQVLQQMQQRVLNHEMRNQAAKLTPQERKEKKTKKVNPYIHTLHTCIYMLVSLILLKHHH